MSFLIDTDWIIDALHGIPAAVVPLTDLAPNGLALSIITLGELYDGAYRLSNPAADVQAIRRFVQGYQILPLTDQIMEHFGRHRAYLRGRGATVPDLDLLIAGTALVHNLTLLTRNQRHFGRIPGIRLYQPS